MNKDDWELLNRNGSDKRMKDRITRKRIETLFDDIKKKEILQGRRACIERQE